MFEQQSAFAAQVSLSGLHSAPPHMPPLQLRSQQSCALVQDWPFGTHTARQEVPTCPATGWHLPLQQVAPVEHSSAAAEQVPGPSAHVPPAQEPEQQSPGMLHVPPTAWHAALPTQCPPVSHSAEQQSALDAQASLLPVQPTVSTHVLPGSQRLEQQSAGSAQVPPPAAHVPSPEPAPLDPPQPAITATRSSLQSQIVRMPSTLRHALTHAQPSIIAQ
jgi:hypothetical protein